MQIRHPEDLVSAQKAIFKDASLNSYDMSHRWFCIYCRKKLPFGYLPDMLPVCPKTQLAQMIQDYIQDTCGSALVNHTYRANLTVDAREGHLLYGPYWQCAAPRRHFWARIS